MRCFGVISDPLFIYIAVSFAMNAASYKLDS